jgi:hypothetical protein
MSFVASADCTCTSDAGVMSSMRPTNARAIAAGAGVIVSGRTASTGT